MHSISEPNWMEVLFLFILPKSLQNATKKNSEIAKQPSISGSLQKGFLKNPEMQTKSF